MEPPFSLLPPPSSLGLRRRRRVRAALGGEDRAIDLAQLACLTAVAVAAALPRPHAVIAVPRARRPFVPIIIVERAKERES